jgi:hypothetical protein
MVYTFSDLYNEVLANLDETGSTGTTLTLAKNFVNQAHQSRLAMQPWKFMEWDSAETFTCSASGTRFYTLHQEFWRPIYFFNRATKSYLIETPNRELADTQVRWNDDTGHPIYFRLTSRSPVAAQPTSASTLTIVSSSALDASASKAIVVRGVTSNGVTSETLTPNGTSSVVSTNSFSKILNVTKSAVWTGNLTMTSNSAAVTNLFLFPTEYGRAYQLIELLSAPTSADVIEYRFIKQPTLLSADNDVPDIPAPHSHILVYDALLQFAGYLTDLSTKSIQAWTDIRNKMELQLAEAYLEGQTIETHPRYVRYMDSDSGSSIRAFSS